MRQISILFGTEIEYFSYNVKCSNTLWFESSDAAREIPDLRKSKDEPMQLHPEKSMKISSSAK